MQATKILVIDDDPDMRTVLSRLLQNHGFVVSSASDRAEALRQLAAEKPAVVLLDVLLSGSDGRELCREIKAGRDTAHIPVIIFSGHPGAAQKIEAYGADDFIAKPFTTEVLFEKLSRQVILPK